MKILNRIFLPLARIVFGVAGLITPAANAGLPDRLFKRRSRWASEVVKDENLQDSLSSRLSVSKALGI